MNLQQLEYFKAIAQLESFTAAAKLLSVTQPALSKAIANLEEELQVPLFEKSGRHIKLTTYGKVFLTYVSNALTELEAGVFEIQKLVRPDSNTITIATTSHIGLHFIPTLLSKFMMEHPTIQFQFNYQPAPTILDSLKKREVDFGFFDAPTHPDPSIATLPVYPVEYVLIVPKLHYLACQSIVSLKQLKDESFVTSCKITQEVLAHYEKSLGYIPKISINPSESTMVESLVAAGAGIAIVPYTPILNTNLYSVIKIKEPICMRTIYMGWHHSSYQSSISKTFKHYMESLTNL